MRNLSLSYRSVSSHVTYTKTTDNAGDEEKSRDRDPNFRNVHRDLKPQNIILATLDAFSC